MHVVELLGTVIRYMEAWFRLHMHIQIFLCCLLWHWFIDILPLYWQRKNLRQDKLICLCAHGAHNIHKWRKKATCIHLVHWSPWSIQTLKTKHRKEKGGVEKRTRRVRKLKVRRETSAQLWDRKERQFYVKKHVYARCPYMSPVGQIQALYMTPHSSACPAVSFTCPLKFSHFCVSFDLFCVWRLSIPSNSLLMLTFVELFLKQRKF